ncbi:haloacid dehalogenase type II [Vreelandella populi]|uniref:(S)-2-haloacid dehalogenase n=1 Tax=Vreelandella populi TaxID=2498858 RepID=A0A433LFB6_9GAMM|nr:haloacid dehalogenase type II [Halomonas populi]RUR37790.1 haloacid dehalogenase type II [Halomonas populi]RUR48699.1 haloacid dehalogenase type II [Halomonas populi]RUR55097.1 haloacid dehalogenase type II [Halomonas populi]
MQPVLAFDVYGTLIDTLGVTTELERRLTDASKAGEFAKRWREKQLEYSFRHGLMSAYVPFEECTHDALAFTNRALQAGLSDNDRDHLMAVYGELPAFPDVVPALDQLRDAGIRCVAFSNGTSDAVSKLLTRAGVESHMDEVVSVDDIKRFKPDPAVYAYLRSRLETRPEQTWLVSSNAFDVIGATHAGLRSAWIRRHSDAPFDPWGVEPDMTVPDLEALAERIIR